MPVGDGQHGMTLVESLLVLALIAIIASAALPSLQGLLERQQLRGAAGSLYTEFLTARMEAIRRNRPVSASFRISPDDGRWCLGLHDDGACDCLDANDCGVAGTPTRIRHGDHFSRVTVRTNFSNDDTITFQPARGTANAGTVRLSSGDNGIGIRISSLGRIRLCSDQLGDYPPC